MSLVAYGAQDIYLTASSVSVDYIYLDKDERKRFAESSHEYFIETLKELDTLYDVDLYDIDDEDDTDYHKFSIDCLDHECEWSMLPIYV